MTMTGKELVRLLEKHGWTVDRIASSHYIMKKAMKLFPYPFTEERAYRPGF